MRSFVFTGIISGALPCLMVAGSACLGADLFDGSDSVVEGAGGEGGCDPSGAGGSAPAPTFPGAGQSGAGNPITAGVDATSCGPGGAGTPVVGPADVDCYYVNSNQNTPMAYVERVVEIAQGNELVHVRLTLNPAFVDNTYGATAVGWGATTAPAPQPGPAPRPRPRPHGHEGHTFRDLVGSDKAQFKMTDGAGELVLDFFLDYLSEDATRPSGYGSLGVIGGEGKMLAGDASAVVAATTSIDRDLNACGYGSFLVDSPETDADYTPNAATPNWDYRVVYDVWVSASAFGAAGFGNAAITYVHASPSKRSSNTFPVTPGPCPPTPCGDDPPPGSSGVGGGGGGDTSTCQEHGGSCEMGFDCCSDSDICVEGVCETFEVPR